jgi:hypothetical protein
MITACTPRDVITYIVNATPGFILTDRCGKDVPLTWTYVPLVHPASRCNCGRGIGYYYVRCVIRTCCCALGHVMCYKGFTYYCDVGASIQLCATPHGMGVVMLASLTNCVSATYAVCFSQ